MRKLILILTLVILIMFLMPTSGCTSRDVAMEFAQSLVQMNKIIIENIDAEITKIDIQLNESQTYLVKLEQVLSPALKWVDYQKTNCKPGKWSVQVTSSGLSQLKNDQFQLTALEALCTKDNGSGSQFSYTIKVKDLTTNQIDDGNTLQDRFTNSKNLLEKRRKATVESRDLSVSTMHNSLKYVNDWKIKDVGGKAYKVSGPGLGWSSTLTTGIWDYNRDKNTLVPGDKQAEELNNIILGKLILK